VNELVALNEIDFGTRTRRPITKAAYPEGGNFWCTPGINRAGTLIITSYAIGMDNTGLFYEAPYPDEICERLEGELAQVVRSSMSTSSRSTERSTHMSLEPSRPSLMHYWRLRLLLECRPSSA